MIKTGFFKTRFLSLKHLFYSVLLLAGTVTANAQPGKNLPEGQDLYKEIARMDSVLFEAFNSRNLDKLKILFSEELEFFHDKGGLTGYQENMESFRELIGKNNDLRRELIAGSMEIYPVKNYGAIQTGQHRFCHTENGKQDCGTFKFVHIWQLKDGYWKLARVISYDH